MKRSDAARRWVGEQLPFLVVLAGLVVSFGYLVVQPDHWVRGTGAIAVVSLLAGALRLLLPTARVGMLAVRSRVLDGIVYAALGAVILVVDIRLRSA